MCNASFSSVGRKSVGAISHWQTDYSPYNDEFTCQKNLMNDSIIKDGYRFMVLVFIGCTVDDRSSCCCCKFEKRKPGLKHLN